MSVTAQVRHRCPECKSTTGLWRGVEIEGWQGVDDQLVPTYERDCTWDRVLPTGEFGCSCGWEGHARDLERLGTDGEPLREVHPRQLAIDVVAAVRRGAAAS